MRDESRSGARGSIGLLTVVLTLVGLGFVASPAHAVGGTAHVESATTLPPSDTSDHSGFMRGNIQYHSAECYASDDQGSPGHFIFTMTEGGGAPYTSQVIHFQDFRCPFSNTLTVQAYLVTAAGSAQLQTGTTYTYFITACGEDPSGTSTGCASGSPVSFTPGGSPSSPPDTAITSGPTGTISTSSPTVAFSGTNATSYQCQRDAGAWTACTSPWTVTGLANGAHTVGVRALGPGGTDPSPATRSFVVDAPDATACARADADLRRAQADLAAARTELKSAEKAVDHAQRKLDLADDAKAKKKARKKLNQAKDHAKAANRAVKDASAAVAAAQQARNDACS
jgi:hypothetical protein